MPTIDDLPLDSHNQYAKNVEQQRHEPLKFNEDRQVVGPARVDVNAPSYPSEVRSLVGEDLCNAQWSAFPALPEEIAKRSNCFSSDLIPRLGSQEALIAIKQRLDKLSKES